MGATTKLQHSLTMGHFPQSSQPGPTSPSRTTQTRTSLSSTSSRHTSTTLSTWTMSYRTTRQPTSTSTQGSQSRWFLASRHSITPSQFLPTTDIHTGVSQHSDSAQDRNSSEDRNLDTIYSHSSAAFDPHMANLYTWASSPSVSSASLVLLNSTYAQQHPPWNHHLNHTYAWSEADERIHSLISRTTYNLGFGFDFTTRIVSAQKSLVTKYIVAFFTIFIPLCK